MFEGVKTHGPSLEKNIDLRGNGKTFYRIACANLGPKGHKNWLFWAVVGVKGRRDIREG